MTTSPIQPAPPLYLLAGGESRRFGSDKALARVAGLSLLEHVARSLSSAASAVYVVADQPGKYAPQGFATIGDLAPHEGPLGGIATALSHRGEGWALVAPCDLLGLRSEWFSALAALALRSEPCDAAAFRAGEWEPLPALYHTRALPAARSLMCSPARSLRFFLDRVRAVPAPLPAEWNRVRRVTTPSDLESSVD